MIKGVYSEKIFIGRENEENVFARSFILSTGTDNIYTTPDNVEVNSGMWI